MKTLKTDSLRNRVWRYVRDMGKEGAPKPHVQAHFSGFSEVTVGKCLGTLMAYGFVKQGGRGKPYRVDEDCRVPLGETASLGPGWDEVDEPGLQQQVIGHGFISADLLTPIAEPVKSVPKSEGAGLRLPAKRKAGAAAYSMHCLAMEKTAVVDKVPQEASQPPEKQPELVAWISSADTMGICSSDGQQIELSAADTRRLFAWLDRVGSAVFAAGQGEQA